MNRRGLLCSAIAVIQIAAMTAACPPLSGNGVDAGAPKPLTGVVAIAAGSRLSCAILGSGDVRCWGEHAALGAVADYVFAKPVTVSGLSGATAIAAGYLCACAVVDGAVWCWGNNAYGQLGNGTTDDSITPVQVIGVADAVSVAIGMFHTCAVRQSGDVACWGGNHQGEFGNATMTSSNTAASSQARNVAMLSTGAQFTCARHTNNQVSCWGTQASCVTAQPTCTCNPGYDPVQIPTAVGMTDATAIATTSANNGHVCAVRANGTVQCWGGNEFGQLGFGAIGQTPVCSPVPQTVSGLASATAVTTGDLHSCALLGDGTVWCWGFNNAGQCGDGSTVDTGTPVQVKDLSNVRAIAAGSDHTCALIGDSTVRCWGDNAVGQLGNPAVDVAGSSVPVTVVD